MLSFFRPKYCKRCSGELAEVERQLLELKAENQHLHQALAKPIKKQHRKLPSHI
jgi:hypothetical protein